MSFYQFTEYPDMSQAVTGCRARIPRLAVVSERLSPGTGFDLVRQFRLDGNLTKVPVLMMVGKDDQSTSESVVQCGADHHLIDSCPRSVLITTISGVLNRRVERSWKALDAGPQQALIGTLAMFNGIANVIGNGDPILYQGVKDACGPLVDAVASNNFKDILAGVRNHDNYSFVHSMRVATYLALFGFNLGLSKDEQVLLASGGLLHDVGKMSIPHEVLNKPGALNAAEIKIMQAHVTTSVTYLEGCRDLPKGILTIAGQHHEKLDGTGYPRGLSGNKLNRLSRMASIIDVFSALTDKRVYKPPMEAEVALNLMVNGMGSHLDTPLLGLFRQMLLDATKGLPEV
jgi:HD-GYP domain-containing protein (c-di-GMP phosphodiesterase class II)